jgi:hypothetical protein
MTEAVQDVSALAAPMISGPLSKSGSPSLRGAGIHPAYSVGHPPGLYLQGPHPPGTVKL